MMDGSVCTRDALSPGFSSIFVKGYAVVYLSMRAFSGQAGRLEVAMLRSLRSFTHNDVFRTA